MRRMAWAMGVLAGVWAAEEFRMRRHAWSLRDRTVVITGGSRGLGLVLARLALAEGARVAICARDRDELRRALADLQRRGHAAGWTCDLRQRDDRQRLVMEVRAQLGPLDLLINNAGVIQVGPVDTMTEADYDEAMAIHFWAPLHLIRLALPDLRRRRGRVVNIASIGAKISVPHMQPYCASKFALAGLSQGMAAELRQHGVRVTTVYPGLMRTGSPRHALFKGRHRDEHAWFSISDSLPGLTISAEHAARRILAACKRGEPECLLGAMTEVATRLHGLVPGIGVRVLAAMNRGLPPPGGIGTRAVPGRESQSRLSPSILTRLTERAAVRHNEIADDRSSTEGAHR